MGSAIALLPLQGHGACNRVDFTFYPEFWGRMFFRDAGKEVSTRLNGVMVLTTVKFIVTNMTTSNLSSFCTKFGSS
jgi:hypothetical protein